MVKRWIVKGCRDYYTSQNKNVRLFRSLQKWKERERWIEAITGDNKPSTFNCGYETLVIREKVRSKTQPSVFHNLP